MKVRCITQKDLPESEWLTEGKIYIVLSVFIDQRKKIMYRLLDDDDHLPALYHSELFTIISSKIPCNWSINIEGEVFELCPKAWLELGFWEDYFDGIEKAEKIFEEEKKIIYQDS